MQIVVTVSQGLLTAGPLPLGAEGMAPLPLPSRCDELALEAALRLKARHGGSITLVAVGVLEAATREAYLGLGADELVQLVDAGLDDLDQSQVAWLLAQAIAPLAADLILCGERTTGGPATGLVPFALAEALGLPIISGAAAVEVAAERVQVERLVERGDRQLLSAPLPALVTVALAFGEPRYPALARAHRARRRMLSLADLGITQAALAALGTGPRETSREKARPRPKKIYVPPSNLSAAERMAALMAGGRATPARSQSGSSFVEGSPAEVAAKMLAFLRQEKLLD